MRPKARESSHVEKARKKLQKQFESDKRKITPEALFKMSLAIEKELSRHAHERIDLKNKKITTVMEQNKEAAVVKSRYVSKLLNQLKKYTAESSQSLGGRIIPK